PLLESGDRFPGARLLPRRRSKPTLFRFVRALRSIRAILPPAAGRSTSEEHHAAHVHRAPPARILPRPGLWPPDRVCPDSARPPATATAASAPRECGAPPAVHH